MNIKMLKDKILQIAIQGKLVEQNPNDEPVPILLEKIKTEKEQLIKEKKIKREKPLPEISEEEKPFEIPDTWEWIRFGDLARYNMGKTPPRKDKTYWDNANYPWVSISDMIPNGKIKRTKEMINENSFNSIFKGNISPKGTLLMSFKLTVGRVSILDIDAFHNEAIISIYPFIDNNDNIKKYLFKVLPLLSQYGNAKGAIKGNTLNSNSINNLIIPLPPLEEQKRIVAKVDELFKLVDELNSNKEYLLQDIEKTKNKILQLAIQGKLVKQNPNDEPASVLLEKIRAEKEQLIKEKKIKREKLLPEISEEEKPFEIPDGWEWVRLSQISKYIKAGGDKPKDFSTVKSKEYEIPVIANGKTNTGIIGYTKIATEENICITVSGRGTIGYPCIRREPFCPVVRLIVINPSANIDIGYLNYVLQYFIEQGVGTSIQQLTVPMITPKVIPLPPLEEQKRIVAQIDKLMNYIDKLQDKINNHDVISKLVQAKSIEISDSKELINN